MIRIINTTMLKETRVLTTIRLSEVQKMVMARIINAPNEYVAFENINEGTNLVTAYKMLIKLGMVDISEGQARVNENGMSVLKNENIIDEGGELTEEGQKYADMKSPGENKKEEEPGQSQEQPEMGAGGEEGGGMDDMGSLGGDEEMPMQMSSFDLLRSLNDEVLLSEAIKRLRQ